MQIDLGPDIESTLAAESASLGITPVELSARVLTQHADRWKAALANHRLAVKKRSLEEIVQWMKESSPNYETHDPNATDWQSIKAEGRRF